MNARTPSLSDLSHFVAEMKRRHVVRVAIGYGAAVFVVLQLAEIVFPVFGIGETGLRILVAAVALLFPPALVLAWIYDVTGRGIERTERSPGEVRIGLLPHFTLLGVTLLTVGVLAAWLVRQGVLEDPPEPAPPTVSEPELVAYQPGTPIRSLAVLPLQDYSGDGVEEYFTAGMQEELTAQLSQIPGLRVVSRTSVQRLALANLTVPGIGRELQVDAVIEGSVRRSDDTVRITVQLIHAASDSHIWTKQYDRAMRNVLALQSEVALDIAQQIQAEISPEETNVLQQVAMRTVDPEAQDAYLRGRYEAQKGTPEGLQAAKGLFESAVKEDSSFAPALAQLAGTRFLIGLADTTLSAEEVARARGEAERAVALDSASQEAQEVLSLIRQHLPVTGRAPAVVTRGLPRGGPDSLGPTPAFPMPPGVPDTAWFQAVTQLGRRIEEQVRFKGPDALHDVNMGRFVGARGLMAAGRFTEAEEMLSELVGDAPDMGPAWDLLARARIAAGNPQGAVDALDRWGTRGGIGAPSADEILALREAVSRDGAKGYWLWQRARLEARVVSGVEVPPLDLAAARAATGDVDGAFQALEQAVAQHDRGLVLLQHDPVWDVLRADPRFADIARHIRTMHVVAGPPGERRPR
jgi:TolB-like protein